MAGQVYVHHYVSSTTFLLGSGAELRGQMTRQPVRPRMLASHGSMHSTDDGAECVNHVSPVGFSGRFA